MIRFSDRELEILLNDTESELVERKKSFKGDTPKKSRQAICAFANDLPNHNKAGVLFIGAEDDGAPSNAVSRKAFFEGFRNGYCVTKRDDKKR